MSLYISPSIAQNNLLWTAGAIRMAKHTLLSDPERDQLFGIPAGQDDLVRLYTFEAVDFDLIRLRREDRNRLGFGLQLALLRYPATLAQVLDRVPGVRRNCYPSSPSNLISRLKRLPITRCATRR